VVPLDEPDEAALAVGGTIRRIEPDGFIEVLGCPVEVRFEGPGAAAQAVGGAGRRIESDGLGEVLDRVVEVVLRQQPGFAAVDVRERLWKEPDYRVVVRDRSS